MGNSRFLTLPTLLLSETCALVHGNSRLRWHQLRTCSESWECLRKKMRNIFPTVLLLDSYVVILTNLWNCMRYYNLQTGSKMKPHHVPNASEVQLWRVEQRNTDQTERCNLNEVDDRNQRQTNCLLKNTSTLTSCIQWNFSGSWSKMLKVFFPLICDATWNILCFKARTQVHKLLLHVFMTALKRERDNLILCIILWFNTVT